MLKALQIAWEKPQFRAALVSLINLTETRRLIAALADDRHKERRLGQLVRSVLETSEIRNAVLMLLNDAEFRRTVMAGIVASLPTRQTLARSIVSALGDPRVRQQIVAALQSASTRSAISGVTNNQLRDRKVRLAASIVGLLLHHSARQLLGQLRQHGVLREIRSN